MISCGKSGTREDIIVFNNGLFIEKHFDYIMKFGWKELRFQVSIPNNGLQDNIINKVRTLVGNGFWVDGYITVDVDFEQYRDFLEMWKCCFSRLRSIPKFV